MKKGLVLKSTGSLYWVKDESGQILQCKVRGKFRIKGIKSTNPIAVGDRVLFLYDEQNELGTIEQIEDRKNIIVRRSVNLSKQTQILAANIDMAYLVVTLSIPETTTMFMDRFLVSAQAYRIPVTILFNKMDLYQEADLERVEYLKSIYEDIGYPCLEVSAHSNLNIDELKLSMSNKTTVFVGHSGVGKSSLIKAVNSDIVLKISQISNIHLTGKHTTTFAEMYEWKADSYIADTPGIKAFGFNDFAKEELSHFFPEIFKISHACKFQNCSHSHEPSCAVREAVEEGIISESRFYNYRMMIEDDLGKHR
jgi:ribosome biogenesis GTPase